MAQSSDASAFDEVRIRKGSIFRDNLRDYFKVFWPRFSQVSRSVRPGVVLLYSPTPHV